MVGDECYPPQKWQTTYMSGKCACSLFQRILHLAVGRSMFYMNGLPVRTLISCALTYHLIKTSHYSYTEEISNFLMFKCGELQNVMFMLASFICIICVLLCHQRLIVVGGTGHQPQCIRCEDPVRVILLLTLTLNCFMKVL